MANVQWIDTGTPAKIKLAKLPDGNWSLVIVGVEPRSNAWRASFAAGFSPSSSGRTLVRQKASFTRNEMQAIFPNLTVVSVPKETTFLYSIASGAEQASRMDISSALPLGLNYLGQEVFQGVSERFIRIQDGGQSPASSRSVTESSTGVPAAFLYGKSPSDLALCADGFVLRMDHEMLRPMDIRKFGGIVHGHQSMLDPSDTRLRSIQEAIEAAMVRHFASYAKDGATESAYQLATKIVNHQPEFIFRSSSSVINQQFSTPLTLSIAAQRILGDVHGKRILEPAIGNSSLVSALQGAEVIGVELDEARARAASAGTFGLAKADVIHGDFNEVHATLPPDFDCVIANPPFGGLRTKVSVNGLACSRLDHLVLARSLALRKPNGLSVYIINSDGHYNQPGMIVDGSANLFNWLCDHYETDAFEVDGELFAKQGARASVRFVVVGNKRASIDKTHRLTELPVMCSPEEVWAAAALLQEKYAPSKDKERMSSKQVAELEDVVFANEYQVQYVPMSRNGEASSMVPANLAGPQAAAFAVLQNSIPDGEVDAFVYKELRLNEIPDFDFVKTFSPEQVDAIALEIQAVKKNRAVILADKTGQGKGRVCAAMLRWAVLNDKLAIFLTEKPNLFSDIWRDIQSIRSEALFTPAIINLGEKVMSTSGESIEVLIKPTPVATQKKMINDGVSPQSLGYNLIMATYSQFNRLNAKSRWLEAVSEGNFLVLDESHNAAGESSTSANISAAIEKSSGVLYSSATFAKGAKNMRVYAKVFPKSVNIDTLASTLEVGGEQLQEVLSSMLCHDGVYIRREDDLSSLVFNVIEPDADTLERNIEISDRVSDALAAIAYISGDTQSIVGIEDKRIKAALEGLTEDQRQGKRAGAETVNIFSRLYTVQRQILLAINTETVIRHGLKALEEGRKPVFGVEQTMEAIIKEFMDIDDEIRSDTMELLSISSLLNRLLDRVCSISYINDYGEREKTSIREVLSNQISDSALLETKIRATDLAIQAAREIIKAIPELSIMPIDAIKQRLEAAGHSIGEISGRGLETREVDGQLKISALTANRMETIFGFNNGTLDATVVTLAGATGLSLHSATEFKDQRQRHLYECQIVNDVSKRLQLFGRVNRRGQTSAPIISTVTTGLPAEMRVLAMQNQKMRKLSANTQSNRNSNLEMDNVPDILNWVGDKVCCDFFVENPDIRRRLHFELLSDKDASDQRNADYYVSKLGRISMLPYKQQVDVYDSIIQSYNAKIEEMSANGINPFEAKTFDIKARVGDRVSLTRSSDDWESIFDSPVFAEELCWTGFLTPMRMKKVVELGQACVSKLSLDERVSVLPLSPDPLRRSVGAISLNLKPVRDAFDRVMEKSVGEKYISAANGDIALAVRRAKADSAPNIIHRHRDRCDWFCQNAFLLSPGLGIAFTGADGEEVQAIIATLSLPDSGREHQLGLWEIGVAIPGEMQLRYMSFNKLFEDKRFRAVQSPAIRNAIEVAPEGEIKYKRWALTGNLFMAAEISASNKTGVAALYSDQHGARHRAVILPAHMDKEDILAMSVPLSLNEAIESSLRELRKSGEVHFTSGFSIEESMTGNGYILDCPGAKATGGMIYLNEGIVARLGDFSGDKRRMSRHFHAASYEYVVTCLYQAGIRLSVSAQDLTEKNEVNSAVKNLRA